MAAPRACVALLALIPCALPHVALAQPRRGDGQISDDARARARDLSRDGLRAFEAGRYAEAIAAFEQAYALAPLPALLLNIAQSHRLAGDCRAALARYLKYLRVDPGSQHQTEVATRIEEMQVCIDQTGRPPGGAPRATAPDVPAETPEQPSDDESPFASAAAPGTEDAPDVVREPEVTDADADAAPALPRRSRRVVVWSLAAGGAVGLGAGIFFGARSRSAASSVDAYLDRGGPWTPEYQALESRGKRDETLAIFGIGLGVAALGAAGLLFYLSEPEASTASAVVPVATPDSAGAAWISRW